MGNALALLEKIHPATGGSSSVRRYEGADHGRRTGSFPINRASVNRDIGMDAKLLRERSKYLYQNTSNARRAINVIANGIVGTGITPTFKTKDKKALKLIKELWKKFGETTVCDFYGRLNYYGITKLIGITYSMVGECMIVRRRVPPNESLMGLQFQVLDMEYLATQINYQILPGGGYTQDGIEYDKRGKTMAYWLFQRHPSDWYTTPVRVDIADIIHVLDVEFPGQNRGVPKGATTIITERDVDEYLDAERMGKKVQAAHAVFRITQDPEAAESADRADFDGDEELERVEPGMMYHLYPGEDIKFNTPPTAPGAEEYKRGQYRSIAAGYGITYEQLTGDLSNVNFSSYRAGWLEGQKSIEHWQWITLIPQFCDRSMLWFLEQVMLAQGGLTKLPDDLEVEWTTPRREMINPLDETEALRNMIRMGGKSWSEAVTEMGYNPDDVLKSYKRDLELWKAAGLKGEWSVDLVPSLKGTPPAKGSADGSSSPPGDGGSGDGNAGKKKTTE